MIKSQLPQWNIKNKRIFVRTDFNVPFLDGKIADDFRLQRSRKTLDYIIKNGGSIIIGTHIGRPKDNNPAFSTQLLLPWFKKNGYTVRYTENIEEAAHTQLNQGEILLLENLRFFPEEKASDPIFAKQLALLAHYYVNDAFGAMHRYDCSIAVLPYEFQENKRSIGFLVEEELRVCDNLLHNPKHPFITIVGGKKIAEKLPIIRELINVSDTIILCPAICFSFLKALNMPIGTSLIDTSNFDICTKIMNLAQEQGIEIIFPIDYQISYDKTYTILSYVDSDNFPTNAFGISIGPKTINLFTHLISHAGTTFFNGAMGFIEHPDTLEGTNAILHAMENAPGITIVAGGDTAQAAFNLHIQDKLTHISTGGGATLAYISNPLLPGLLPFEEE